MWVTRGRRGRLGRACVPAAASAARVAGLEAGDALSPFFSHLDAHGEGGDHQRKALPGAHVAGGGGAGGREWAVNASSGHRARTHTILLLLRPTTSTLGRRMGRRPKLTT